MRNRLTISGWAIVVLLLACLALGGVLWREHRANYPAWYSAIAQLHDPAFASSRSAGHIMLSLACQSPSAQMQARLGRPLIYAQVLLDVNVKTGRLYPIQVTTAPPDFRCPTK